MNIKVRFAPSPTGSLHLGAVRTAIFNYLFAKKNNGKILVRIEDTDKERSSNESLIEILDSLRWLGLDWDEGPIKQSDRLEIYKAAADKLIDEDLAYRCYMTQDEVSLLKDKAKAENKVYKYPNTWREKKETPNGRDFVIRFKTPYQTKINFNDTLRGNITIDSNTLDDFIIIKSDGFPTYNFASALDDAEMGITNIIRGEDHLSNTPKQVLIFNSIKKKLPNFTHVSMILGKDKTKLSKRHGAESINSFKEKGYLPISIINYLARLGWAYGDQEIFTLNEMISNFSLDNLSKSPAVFDSEKLSWVNNIQIKNYPNSELKERLKLEFIDGVDEELAINAVKEKNKDLNELQKSLNFCLLTNQPYENELINQLDNQAVLELKKFIIVWETKKPKKIEEIKEVFTNYLNENEIKMKSLALPLRILLTGTKSSPGIFEILKILGHEIVIERIKKFIKNNEK
tara:strand:+ start:9772 stop:11145 length:1374 start_codon:yes stop_codon:yes gene_type:complete